MAVLNMQPHRLSYLISECGYEDENGDFHEGESRWSENWIGCDAVPATGKATETVFEDGVVKKYTYTVYIPSCIHNFKIGERVRIELLGGVTKEFEVKGFQRWQLQCKIWV